MTQVPNLPADMVPHLHRILSLFGESVSYYDLSGALKWTALVSIQSPAPVPLFNDLDQDYLLIYAAASDVTEPPERMARMDVRGRPRTVEDVVLEAPQGIPVYYMMRVRG